MGSGQRGGRPLRGHRPKSGARGPPLPAPESLLGAIGRSRETDFTSVSSS